MAAVVQETMTEAGVTGVVMVVMERVGVTMRTTKTVSAEHSTRPSEHTHTHIQDTHRDTTKIHTDTPRQQYTLTYNHM